MEYRNLGRSGLKVSELCLGTMQFGWSVGEEESFDVLSAAFEAGINFIDTADIYSRWVSGNDGGVSETIIGNWIKQRSIPREQLVIATKVRGQMGTGSNDEGLSRKHICDAVERSLQRLQVETIDLYQTHWTDEDTPIDETLRAMDDLVRQGKIRYIGCSNYPAWRLMESLWSSERLNLARYDSIQPHYSLVYRDEYEPELAAVCQKYGVGVIPYSPLAGGFLTGKYRKSETLPESVRVDSVKKYMTDHNWDIVDKLELLGQTRGKSISQMALGWLLSQPEITSPIIGPRTINQLTDNVGSVGLLLSAEEMLALNEVGNQDA